MNFSVFRPAIVITTFCIGLVQIPAQAAVKAYFSASFDGRLAQHTYAPNDGASRRFGLALEQKLTFNSNWNAVIGGQNWYETIYTAEKYPLQLRNEDSQELRFNDTYLQFKSDHWRIQLGYQQIVWGETFGSFYADIVNPKDLREGVPGNLSKIRIATPAANFRYINKRFSAQAIFLPQPFSNVLPLPGSDYFPTDLAQRAGFQDMVVHRERSMDWTTRNGELGGRVSQTLGNFDLSLLYFNYLDRNPYYLIGPGSSYPQLIVLDEAHSRVDSTGGSLAADFAGYVFRGEAVFTRAKLVPLISTNTILTVPVEEMAYAVSLDFPTWKRVNFTIQYSDSRLSKPGDYLLRARQIQYLSFRARANILSASSLDVISTISTQDPSARNQIEYTHPLSNVTELRVGVENYVGSIPSEFGKLARSNRAYLSLVAQFNGI